MNLPYSDNLNIGYLSRLFERNRVFNCYKYFWMLAILNKISVVLPKAAGIGKVFFCLALVGVSGLFP